MIVRELVTVLGFRVDDNELQAAERRIKDVANRLKESGMQLTKFVTLPLSLLGGFAIKASSDLEGLRVSFETMLGSAEKADVLIRQLVDFAAKTPFQMPDVQTNAKMLLGMGIEAEKIIPTMKAIGDIAAGVNQPLSRIALNFGQVRTQTKLSGRDLRDFAVQGVPLIAELAKMLNVSEASITDMTSAGQISFAMVEQAFINMTSEGGKFANLMEKRSKTLQGIWSNLLDSFIKFLAPLGDAITETFRLKEILNLLINTITRLTTWFTGLNKGTQQLLIILGGIAAAIGPILLGLSGILFLISSINFAAVGITAAVLAVVAVFALFTEDIITWVQGGDSLTGKLLGPWKDWRDGLFMIFDSISKFLDDFFEALLTGKIDKIAKDLETFTFIIKDVIKSFLQDIENLFGEGIGKFLYKTLSGTVHFVERASELAGTITGSGGRFITPEQVSAATAQASGAVTVNFENKVQFAAGTGEEEHKKFLRQLEHITRTKVVSEIKNAINENPEVE